jgi:hypothetical protein
VSAGVGVHTEPAASIRRIANTPHGNYCSAKISPTSILAVVRGGSELFIARAGSYSPSDSTGVREPARKRPYQASIGSAGFAALQPRPKRNVANFPIATSGPSSSSPSCVPLHMVAKYAGARLSYATQGMANASRAGKVAVVAQVRLTPYRVTIITRCNRTRRVYL